MKSIIPIIFLVVFLTILVGSNIYLSKRLAYYFSLESAKILYFVFGAISLFMIAGIMAFSNTQNMFVSVLYVLASVLIGLMLYLLLSMFLVDIVNLFTKISPKILGLTAILLAVAISSIGILNAFYLRKTEIEIPIEGLQDEVRIVHLTDIHIGHFRGQSFVQSVVDKTNSLNPDFVVITGDLFDGTIRLEQKSLAPLKDIKVPIYFVEGNHDNYTGIKTIKDYLRDIGVHVLENELALYQDLQIIGLNHMRPNRRTRDIHASNGVSIEEVLDSLPISDSKPSIVLHHSPDGVEYANKHGVDLFLAGHTHAGQIFPISIVAYYMFAYNRGLHEYKNTKMFVSQGVGTFGPPMRIGTRSEIVLLKLDIRKSS